MCLYDIRRISQILMCCVLTHRVVPCVGTEVSEEYVISVFRTGGVGTKWIHKWLGQVTVCCKSESMSFVGTVVG
jgi:hypothetical protein